MGFFVGSLKGLAVGAWVAGTGVSGAGVSGAGVLTQKHFPVDFSLCGSVMHQLQTEPSSQNEMFSACCAAVIASSGR